jgi:Na+/H+ antiporter NhaA
MGNQINPRFKLFLLGVGISILIATAVAILSIIYAENIGWGATTIAAIASFIPAVLLGLPYLNAKFNISYDKKSGLSVKEETKTTKGSKCPTKR